MQRTESASGFSLVELLIVLVITMGILAFSILGLRVASQLFGVQADARAIGNQLSLARLRAAAEFTHARLTFNLAAGTYQLETNQGGVWTIEGGVYNLSSSSAFGFGSVTSPAGTQTTIAQTTPIVFNSRGIPVDATTDKPIGTDAIYLNNGAGQYYAVTVSASGGINVWQRSGSTWSQF
jgi:prepilin-type N-terminal cleavage/methylation domain-containing protein